MPFINSNVTQGVEAEVVPEGTYDLRVQLTKDRHNAEKDSDSIEIMILIEDAEHQNAAPVTFYLPLVGKSDDAKSKNFKLLQQHRFLAAFSIPFDETGFNTDDFPGATATLAVKQREVTPRDTSKPSYMVNEVVLPRLSSEEASAQAAAPATRRRRG